MLKFFHVYVSTNVLFRTIQNVDAFFLSQCFFDWFWGNLFICWNFWLSFYTFLFCHHERKFCYIVFIFTWLDLPEWETVVPGEKGLVLYGLADFFVLGLSCAITLAELRLGGKAWCVSWLGDSISSSRTLHFCQLHHSFFITSVQRMLPSAWSHTWSQ